MSLIKQHLHNLQEDSMNITLDNMPAVCEKYGLDLDQEKVAYHTVSLCGKLYDSIKEQTLRWHEQAIMSKSDTDHLYHIRKIREINESGVDKEFYIVTGRKYLKIVYFDGSQRSAHAFVDKKTGDVYKSASWNAPAKGVRFNLLDDTSREDCFARADWAGGYLYAR